jgi:hypothetical protein
MSAQLDRIGNVPRPPFAGAFHNFVLSVFLQQAARSRELRAGWMRRVHRTGQRPTSGAVQRWEGEGGSIG